MNGEEEEGTSNDQTEDQNSIPTQRHQHRTTSRIRANAVAHPSDNSNSDSGFDSKNVIDEDEPSDKLRSTTTATTTPFEDLEVDLEVYEAPSQGGGVGTNRGSNRARSPPDITPSLSSRLTLPTEDTEHPIVRTSTTTPQPNDPLVQNDPSGASAYIRCSGVKEEHRKLLILNHPHTGGSNYLAGKLNETKDLLLKKKRD